ncbi:MAG: diadenylate cyclase CdaA [Verrucomicrobiota bacterium]
MNILQVLEILWRPVLEITILTVGIYFAFNFVRRTRGWPVVMGYFVLLLLMFFTTVLNLQVLSRILQAFFAFSAVAILVIFQPELRRLLAEIGTLPFMNIDQREKRENIEVIVQSAERLSEARIGALIAMAQTVRLEEYVESGVVVDCEATPEMIETIFFPNNAIHDGGILVKGDRIARAACIFPLTQRQDLNKSLGTRHRAAIGLSEETDAVIVVVSEENGALSVAYKGQLQKGISLEELRAFLTAVFVNRQKPRTAVEAFRAWMTERTSKTPAAEEKVVSK